MTSCFRFESIRNILTGLVVMTTLSGCLKDEDATKLESDGAGTIRLSGSVGDGPIVGADMAVTANDGAVLITFQSTVRASYNISVVAAEKDYPLSISASNGTDLVTGLAPDFEMSSVVVDAQNSSVANVNPFSTFAVELADLLPGGATSENLLVAEGIVSSALNSGLTGLDESGPIGTPIDETNVTEIVKSSESLSEIVRRTRSLLVGAGIDIDANQVVLQISADLTDGVVDGVGATTTNKRTAAVSTLVSAQVLLESMANQLHVNGVDATNAMRDAIESVNGGPPAVSIDQFGVSSEMIAKTRIGLAAAFAMDPDPEIRRLHSIVSSISPGQNGTIIRIALPANYRNQLQNVLNLIASADDQTLDMVNAIARSNGDIEEENRAPSIQGSPDTSAAVDSLYTFTPSASDPDGDSLTFEIANLPPWATFNNVTGNLSGTPGSGDVGSYPGIVIGVTDGEFQTDLPAFSVTVTIGNRAPQVSGDAPTSVSAGNEYVFSPTASDPDGDPLTFSISGLPSWANFDPASGRLSGTPTENDVDTYSGLVISVSDGQLSDSLAPFSITVTSSVINRPPQISGTPQTTINENDSYSFTPTASDPDGDVLTFTITGLPVWAIFDSTTGRISGVPSSADVGTYSGITITVSDGLDFDTLAAFSITVEAVSLGSATLSWDAPTENADGSNLTDLAGYKVYWRTPGGNYAISATINNPSVTTHAVDNLSPGTYEFVVTAFKTSGIESVYSGSATMVVP